MVWDSYHLYWCMRTVLAPPLTFVAGKVRKTTLENKTAFLSWQSQDTFDSLLLYLVCTPTDCKDLSPSCSRLSLDSVLIRMMYGCGFFRKGGIVGGTLITINRAGDFKQNHTPVKGLFLLSVCRARLVLGFTQVCVCVYAHVWMWVWYSHAYVHTNNTVTNVWTLDVYSINHTKSVSQLEESSGAKRKNIIISIPLMPLLSVMTSH